MKTVPLTTPVLTDDDDIQPPADAAEPLPHPAFSRRLAASVLKYFENRGQLLGIEGREALQHLSVVVAWLALGGASLFAGWLLLATSLVGVLTYCLSWSWVKATAVAGAAHILLALAAGFVVWKRLNTARWFPDSLNELKKDRAWLTTQTTKN